MGERKVLNKYIPADFDPKLVPRGSKPKDDLVPVRMMLPFSIQCSTCSSFMYRGRKFNSKKEPMRGPDGKYLGIQRFRFYIKCTVCSRPVTFLTDPKNADYEMESGATRNYEVHKDREKTDEEIALEREQEDKADPMKALENRVLDSQREMADLDNLDEIKAMNMRHVQLMSGKGVTPGSGGFDESAKALLDVREAASKIQNDKSDEDINENGLTASEEAMVKSIKFGNAPNGQNVAADQKTIQRLGDDDEDEFEQRRRRDEALLEKQQRELAIKTKLAAEAKKESNSARRSAAMPVIKAKRKQLVKAPASKKVKVDPNPVTKSGSDSDDDGGGGALGGLLGAYGSDSDSD